MSRKIVIVGAGPGGLAAAMLLATTGAHVTLLERGARVGGRTQRIEQDGFAFDTGPTFFLYPQILEGIYEQCGYDLHRDVPMTRLDPIYDLLFGKADGTTPDKLTISGDRRTLAEGIAKFNPSDARNVERFLAENDRKFEAFKPILRRPFNGVGDLFKPDMLGALPYLAPWRSVDADLRRFFADPRVRLAFTFQSKYLGMSPFQCPSLFTILSYLEHAYGVWHPTGGCNALVTDMARKAEAMGVKIRLNTEVTGFDFQGRKVTAVQTADETFPVDGVMLNADFAQAMHKLVPNELRRRWHDRKLETAKYSCSTFMLYLGIKGKIDHLAHHTIYLSSDYERNLADIEAGTLPTDPSLYVQNASVTDPTLAPQGHSSLYVLVPVSHNDGKTDWPTLQTTYRQSVLQQLGKLGLQGLEDRIVTERCYTPQTWQTDLQVYKGATFNLAHNLRQMLLFRPRNRFEEFEGMYLVGGGTHPGSGLPVIFESARMSSELMAEDLGLALGGSTERPVAGPAPFSNLMQREIA